MSRVASTLILLALPGLGACLGPTDPPGDAGVVLGTVGFIGVPCLPPGQVPPCDGAYPEYVLRVYEAGLRWVVAQDTTDAQGHYAVRLAPGEYAFVTQNGIQADDLAVTRFAVVAHDTVTVDLVVDTGIR
jgi:hypothetical protein